MFITGEATKMTSDQYQTFKTTPILDHALSGGGSLTALKEDDWDVVCVCLLPVRATFITSDGESLNNL